MMLRLALSAASRGTNDIDTWENFALHANTDGVLSMYGHFPDWNHPPVAGYLAGWLRRLSLLTGLRFPVAFKLAPITADALCLVLLWKIWRHRSSNLAAPLAAVAIFSFSPDAILNGSPRQPGPDSVEQDALFVPNLRAGEEHSRRRFCPQRRQGEERRSMNSPASRRLSRK